MGIDDFRVDDLNRTTIPATMHPTMTLRKRGRPVAACTICRRFEYQVQNIHGRCSAQDGNKRCRGVFASSMDLGDWRECGDCAATGRHSEAECSSCNGSGWRYLRPRIGIFQ